MVECAVFGGRTWPPLRCTNPKVISASFGAQWASGSSSGRWLPGAPPGATRCWLMSRRVRGGVSTEKACLSLCVVLPDGLTDPEVISAVFTHVCDDGNESCPGLYESVRVTRRAGEERGERGRSMRDRVRRAAATRRSSGHERSTMEGTHGGRRRGPQQEKKALGTGGRGRCRCFADPEGRAATAGRLDTGADSKRPGVILVRELALACGRRLRCLLWLCFWSWERDANERSHHSCVCIVCVAAARV